MNNIRLDNKTIYYQVFYKNIKHMYLRVLDSETIKISCNKSVSASKISDFIIKNQIKILKKMSLFEHKIPLYNNHVMLIFGEKLNIACDFKCKRNTNTITNNTIKLFFKSEDFDSKYVESIYKDKILNTISELIEVNRERIEKYIDIENIKYKTQLMKSRFGSCIPSKRIIKLNSLLGRFDKRYLEAVLIHEIIHLNIKNHQKEFYQIVKLLCPNYSELMKELKILTRKYVI